MEKKKIKVVASTLSLCFYLFMATGSDESSTDYQMRKEAEPIKESAPSKSIEREPVFSNDELEEEQDTILMRDTYDNDEMLEE